METGGGALRWFCERFCQAQAQPDSADEVSTYALLNRMAEAVRPGSDGLLFLPWLTGERAPVLDHYARAAFVGLSMGHTKAHLARAVMEGVGNHIRWMIESLEGIGLEVGPLRTIGGGSTSRLWTQIISDICGRELQVVEHPLEAGAIGAALTVAVGLGVYPSMEAVDGLISVGRTVRPIEGRRQARYQVQYHEYRALYDALSPIYRRRHTPD
jgi:xylulokinase